MSYLIPKDLSKQIQSENLSQIIGGDTSILASAELTAIEEANSYLQQRYDTSREFKDLTEWKLNSVYKATDRVYLNAPAYNTASTYAQDALVLQGGVVYICTTAISVPEAFTASKWTALGSQYEIFFAKYPKTPFAFDGQYPVGSGVFWKDKIYTSLIATRSLSQETALQYRQLDNLPAGNIAPDDPTNGLQYWGSGADYSVPANTDISNAAYWTAGDNRSQQLLTYVVDITLYHVHSRISPRNIPDLRVKRYDDARGWLKMASRGEITPALPLIQPVKGGRIRYGGNIKQINSY